MIPNFDVLLEKQKIWKNLENLQHHVKFLSVSVVLFNAKYLVKYPYSLKHVYYKLWYDHLKNIFANFENFENFEFFKICVFAILKSGLW